MAKERHPKAITGMLIRQKPKQNAGPIHERPEGRTIEAALKEKAAGALTQTLQQAIERWLAQSTVGGGALEMRRKLAEPGVKLEIPEVANGDNHASALLHKGRSDKFDVRPQFVRAHRSGLYCAGKILADSPEVFLRQRLDFGRSLLGSETHREVAQRHAPVPPVQPISCRAACPAQARHPWQGKPLQQSDQPTSQ
jgi:hypothetical protein